MLFYNEKQNKIICVDSKKNMKKYGAVYKPYYPCLFDDETDNYVYFKYGFKIAIIQPNKDNFEKVD